MKNKGIRLLALVAIIVTVGGRVDPAEVQEENQKLTFVTAKGIPYMVGLAMENLSSRFADGLKLDVVSVGNEPSVLKLLNEGKVDLGIVTLTEIAKFLPTATDREKAGLRLIMGGHAAIVAHFFARRDLPIHSMSDLKGRRVGLPLPGSEAETLAKAILDTHRLSYDDIKPVFMRAEEQVKAFEVGFADALILVVPTPSPVIPSPAPEKIAALERAKLISLEENHVAELITRYPGYSRHEIEASTYKGQSEGIFTVARKNTVIGRKDLKAESVYAFVKAVLENPVEFAKLCPLAMAYTPKNVLPGTSIVPLHPGAEQYYREQGIVGYR